jgi:hypothetical protein
MPSPTAIVAITLMIAVPLSMFTGALGRLEGG